MTRHCTESLLHVFLLMWHNTSLCRSYLMIPFHHRVGNQTQCCGNRIQLKEKIQTSLLFLSLPHPTVLD